MTDELIKLSQQVEHLTKLVEQLLSQHSIKDWYSAKEIASITGISPDTIREHLRQRRIVGEHIKGTGRGNKPEWRVSHDELMRYQNEGLRPKVNLVDLQQHSA